MRLEFDPVKSERNRSERGFGFEQVAEFDFETAVVRADERRAYPEPRWVAAGYVAQRLHILCFTPISGGIRVISFRKANAREVYAYEQTFAAD